MISRIVRFITTLALCALVITPTLGASAARVSAAGASTASVATPTWPLESIGDRGTNVLSLQYLLQAHGYTLVADGIFGTRTRWRVEQFQAAHGLRPDGIVGPLTWPRLVVTVRRGSVGPAVKAAQYQLARKYLFPNALNGIFGGATYTGVTRFQRSHGVPVTGIVGSTTWQALVSGASIGLATTPTIVPSLTSTPPTTRTVTVTPTLTATAKPTLTPTVQPTATRTPTPRPTATHTPTPRPTATHTPTPRPTATHTPTPRPTATRTPTPRPTATPIPHAVIAVSPVVVNRGGLVSVSGRGFAPRETVFIYFQALPKAVTAARTTATGVLLPTGVTVPYALSPGAHTLVALGASSRRAARATVIVMSLVPSITLGPSTAAPGATVTVAGKGFGPREQITLALNGAALATTPSVITTVDGAFRASFLVPTRILNGANTVSAIGNRSRVTAVALLNGVLPLSARFYFAGGISTATEHSSLHLLNPHGEPTVARLTFYFASGATDTRVVTIQPTSEKVVTVASLESISGPFGLYIEADRQISAVLTIDRDGRDGDVLLGNTGLGQTWYLAEGYTGLTFHESVAILNPDPATSATVRLLLLPFGGRPAKSVTVVVPPHASYTADINPEMPSQSLSIIATSDRPVAVERTLTFSNNGYGMTTRAGTNTAATSWIFAEGTTTTRFQTFLTVLNPNAVTALVTASFFGSAGNALGSRTIAVAPLSRANIKLNDFLHASGIATVVTSDRPIVVERPEYFGSPNDAGVAGSDVFGRNGAGVQWSFPGGDTAINNEYLLLYNPSSTTVPVDATFYGENGTTLTRRINVPPTVRYTVNVNALIGGFVPVHGAVLRSANRVGFVAEQSVFAPTFATLRSTEGLAQ